MKTADKVLKTLTDDNSRGFFACLDKDDNASAVTNLNSVHEVSFLFGTLIVHFSQLTGLTVRNLLDNIAQAAHLLDANQNKIGYRKADSDDN